MDGGRAPSARGRRSRGRCQLPSDDRVRFSAEHGRAVLLPIPSRGAGWRYIRDRSVTPGSLGSGLASPQAERERDSGHECPRTESRRAPSRVSSTSASCVPPQRARPHHRREWRAATVPADLTHPDLRQRAVARSCARAGRALVDLDHALAAGGHAHSSALLGTRPRCATVARHPMAVPSGLRRWERRA